MKNKVRKSPGAIAFIVIVGVTLLVYCLSLCVPILWAFNASTKTEMAYFENPFSLGGEHTLRNYTAIWNKLEISIKVVGQPRKIYNVWTMLTYTLLLSFGKPTLVIFFTTVMAYCLSKFKFFGSKLLYSLGIVLMILPIYGTMGAQMKIYRALGIYDNIFMNIIISPTGCFWGMNFLMLYAAFKRIPTAYSEAAKIDGANDFDIFYRIMFPMVFTTSVVFWLLSFLGTWNDYNTSLIWLPSYPTLAYGMWVFKDQITVYGSSTPEVLAGFLMMSIPLAVLITISKNLITEKMQVGGLKG